MPIQLAEIIQTVEDTVNYRQDELSQIVNALASTIGTLPTAHRLAVMAQELFEFSRHEGPLN